MDGCNGIADSILGEDALMISDRLEGGNLSADKKADSRLTS